MEEFRTDVAWAAGLFEGEGCFNVYFRPRRGKTPGQRGMVQARLGMTDRDVVEKFARVVGVGTVYRPQVRRPGEKDIHTWCVYGFEGVQYLVAMFWPWLGARRRAKAQELLLAARFVQRNGDRPNCPRGHPYAGDNLVIETIRRGDRTYIARRCRICRREQDRARKAA